MQSSALYCTMETPVMRLPQNAQACLQCYIRRINPAGSPRQISRPRLLRQQPQFHTLQRVPLGMGAQQDERSTQSEGLPANQSVRSKPVDHHPNPDGEGTEEQTLGVR